MRFTITIFAAAAALGLFAGLATPPAAVAATSTSCAKAVSWANAGKYVGKVVAVRGRVVDAYYAATSSGRPTFLNFRKPYKGAFTAVIWGADRDTFGGYPEDLFRGKTVCVTGKVTWYNGPQMTLRRQSQIRILR